MNKVDESLAVDANLRNGLHEALKAAVKGFKRSNAGKVLTRLERRGMFVTHLRSEFSSRSLFANHKSFEYYSGRDWPRKRRGTSLAWNNQDLIRTLISAECWYDAGILAESRGWRDCDNSIVRSIMDKVWDEINSEPDTSEESLSALNNILLSMKMCVDDAARLNTNLENEAKQTDNVLSKL